MSRQVYKVIYSWTPDIAYLVGLFASDGCLINDNRHLNITSKDLEIITITKSILNINVKVVTKISGYGGQAYHLSFSNVALYDFLLKIGLTPAKSKTIGSILVPDEYYADFFRGYFDGDGTIYGYWDTRWRSSLMYYTEIISASPSFLVWLQAQNVRLFNTSPGKIKPGTRADKLSYAKTDSQLLFKRIYYRTDLPKLTRKYDKFVAFLKSDPYANKDVLFARVLESVDRLA